MNIYCRNGTFLSEIGNILWAKVSTLDTSIQKIRIDNGINEYNPTTYLAQKDLLYIFQQSSRRR